MTALDVNTVGKSNRRSNRNRQGIGGHCASHSHQKEKACRTCTAFTSQDRTKGKEGGWRLGGD